MKILPSKGQIVPAIVLTAIALVAFKYWPAAAGGDKVRSLVR